MIPLILTPDMADHARFIDAGHGQLFDNLIAAKRARQRGEVFVRPYTRKK